jgi:hypothetical protein
MDMVDKFSISKKTFRDNSCNTADIHKVLNSKERIHSQWKKVTGLATVPNIQGTVDGISRHLIEFQCKNSTYSSRKGNALADASER